MLLPDCTLFPHGGLPLYIFEPRYRKMLEEALEGDCFFAVARLLGEEDGNPADFVAPVGTIGLVRASREQDDGTSQLLIHGVMRVRFTEWLDGRDYPLCQHRAGDLGILAEKPVPGSHENPARRRGGRDAQPPGRGAERGVRTAGPGG